MGSGTSSRRKGADGHGGGTSGKAGSKPSGPDPSRVVTGLPLRTPQLTPAPQKQTQTAAMAGKDEVFEKASSIFVVLGASASDLYKKKNLNLLAHNEGGGV